MSTPERHFEIDYPYHIYNRGNHKGEIFFNSRDYLRFLKRMKKYKEEMNIEIFCYCLMPNHFHILAKQTEEDALTKFMLHLSTSYAKYFNIKYELVGRLFQERFKAKIVDTDEYLLQLSRYIHLNPISDNLEILANMSSTPGVELSKFPWSSYNEYVSGKQSICATTPILSYFSKTLPNLSYQSFVEEGIPADAAALIAKFI